MVFPTPPAPRPRPALRVARPTDRLTEVVAFYRDGIGLTELHRFTGHAGYDGVMLGHPGASWHLEFTSHRDGSPGPVPGADNLLVLYYRSAPAREPVLHRLAGMGIGPVVARNPYWADVGAVVVADPDGWQVVLVPNPGQPGRA